MDPVFHYYETQEEWQRFQKKFIKACKKKQSETGVDYLKAYLQPLFSVSGSPKLNTDEMKLKYKYCILRLLKDKQLRRFAFETIEQKELLGMIKPPVTAKLIKNEKDRYRLLVSDGIKTFDVRMPDNDKLELMKKAFNVNN